MRALTNKKQTKRYAKVLIKRFLIAISLNIITIKAKNIAIIPILELKSTL